MTSRRLVTTYYGQHYEVQIVEGVPADEESELYYTSDIMQHEKKGPVTTAFEVIKVVAVAAAGFVQGMGDTMTVVATLADIHQTLTNPATIIDDIAGEVTVLMSSHVKYILVKRYQSPDLNNQITCYMGTAVAYSADADIKTTWFEDGRAYTETCTDRIIEGTCYSDYFDDYSLAVKNYHNYISNNTDFLHDYRVTNIKMTIFEKEYVFSAPFEYPVFIW